MRAKIDLRVELLDGQDAGYVLSEENRIVELDDIRNIPFPDMIKPYRVTVEFVTPNLLREGRERSENNGDSRSIGT